MQHKEIKNQLNNEMTKSIDDYIELNKPTINQPLLNIDDFNVTISPSTD